MTNTTSPEAFETSSTPGDGDDSDNGNGASAGVLLVVTEAVEEEARVEEEAVMVEVASNTTKTVSKTRG